MRYISWLFIILLAVLQVSSSALHRFYVDATDTIEIPSFTYSYAADPTMLSMTRVPPEKTEMVQTDAETMPVGSSVASSVVKHVYVQPTFLISASVPLTAEVSILVSAPKSLPTPAPVPKKTTAAVVYPQCTPTPAPKPTQSPAPSPTPAPMPKPKLEVMPSVENEYNRVVTYKVEEACENAIINLINQERENAGLAALLPDQALIFAARIKSSDFIINDYFAHTSPRYGTPAIMLSTWSISNEGVGENLQMTSTFCAQHIHGRLMASDRHKENILRIEYTRIGIGIVSHKGRMYTTQLFVR